MSWERSDYSRKESNAFVVPAPSAPIYSIQAFWEPTEIGQQDWEYTIPYDNMIYSICGYCYYANQITWLRSRIQLNAVTIWEHIGGFGGQYWRPGYKSAIRIKGGDVLTFRAYNMMATDYQYFWQMDFWRNPINE